MFSSCHEFICASQEAYTPRRAKICTSIVLIYKGKCRSYKATKKKKKNKQTIKGTESGEGRASRLGNKDSLHRGGGPETGPWRMGQSWLKLESSHWLGSSLHKTQPTHNLRMWFIGSEIERTVPTDASCFLLKQLRKCWLSSVWMKTPQKGT